MSPTLRIGSGLLALAVAALLGPSTAGATWSQPWSGVSAASGGIEQVSVQHLSSATIGGVPYVAWIDRDPDGTTFDVRVARLNGNTWEQPWTGVSATHGGINQSASQEGLQPSLADIGGTAYVAWSEADGKNHETRVARLDGNTWKQPWTGVSATYGGINQSTAHGVDHPMLTNVNGVPHVAWTEDDGANLELRVARLNGNQWQQPWTGVSATYGGINQNASKRVYQHSLAAIGGVPYVAWAEDDGANVEARVARLNGNQWQQPSGAVTATAGGVNQSSSKNVNLISVAGIAGVPYVAWSEDDGANLELRVARLSGKVWQQPWIGAGGASGGINQDSAMNAGTPSLAAFGDVPYVAWVENDGGTSEARVARLNGITWQQPWTGVTATSGAINQNTKKGAATPVLTSVGGLPQVAWVETNEAGTSRTRAARLEPEFTAIDAAAGDTTAILQASVRTYGFAFPVGFEYGTGVQSSTDTETTPAGSDAATITRTVSGLVPSTAYQARAFAIAGLPQPRAFSATVPFTTQAPGAPPPSMPVPTSPITKPRATPTRATCRRVRTRGTRRVRCTVTFSKAAKRRLTLRLTRRGTTYASRKARSRTRIVRLTMTRRRATGAGAYVLVVTTVRPSGAKSTLRLPVTLA